MKSNALLKEIIIPTLKYLDMDSEVAQQLLLGTLAQESHMGKYLLQLGGGPAVSPYQIEPATHRDIWTNYLFYRPSLQRKLTTLLCPGMTKEQQLTGNLYYATAIARLVYRRVSDPLPSADVTELARYWKKHYNTEAGKGTPEEFKRNYNRFVVRSAQ